MWDPTLELEPRPADGRDAFRWEHTRLRARILEERHNDDLVNRQVRRYGGTRAQLIGTPSLSDNFLKSLCRQLSSLYMDRGDIRHPGGAFPELLGEDVPDATDPAELVRIPGFVENAGFWSIMSRVQLWTLGLNEMLVQPVVADIDTDTPRVVYRVVPPHHVTAIADFEDPSRPVLLRECVKRTHPDNGKTGWCWDEWDIRDREHPVYRIISVQRDGKDGEDVTSLFVPDASGEGYSWRRKDGTPVLPWVVYHKTWPTALWDPFDWTAAVEGTLELAIDWAFWRHCFQDASFPLTWSIGCEIKPDEVVAASGGNPATGHYINDPTRVARFIADDNATNPQVGRFPPGADVKMLGEALAARAARLGQQMDVDASDILKTSDPRSGISLAITQEAKRQAQIKYRPQFARADQDLVALTALVLNRALGTDYPEDGYQVDHADVTAPGSDGAPSEGSAVAVQDTALNGAQVVAAQGIVMAVVDGKLPRDSAVAMLSRFFQIEPADAEVILGSVGKGFEATPDPTPAPIVAPIPGDPAPDPEPAPPPAK